MAIEKISPSERLEILGLTATDSFTNYDGREFLCCLINNREKPVSLFWKAGHKGKELSFLRVEIDFDELNIDQVHAILDLVTDTDVINPPDVYIREIARELRSDYKNIIHSYDPLQSF